MFQSGAIFNLDYFAVISRSVVTWFLLIGYSFLDERADGPCRTIIVTAAQRLWFGMRTEREENGNDSVFYIAMSFV